MRDDASRTLLRGGTNNGESCSSSRASAEKNISQEICSSASQNNRYYGEEASRSMAIIKHGNRELRRNFWLEKLRNGKKLHMQARRRSEDWTLGRGNACNNECNGMSLRLIVMVWCSFWLWLRNCFQHLCLLVIIAPLKHHRRGIQGRLFIGN